MGQGWGEFINLAWVYSGEEGCTHLPTCPLGFDHGPQPTRFTLFLLFFFGKNIYQYFNKVKRVRHEPIVFLDRLGIKLLISHKRIELTLFTITPIISYVYIN